MSVELLAAGYAACGLGLWSVLMRGYRDGRLRWYNVVAGIVLWPVTLVWGLVIAFRPEKQAWTAADEAKAAPVLRHLLSGAVGDTRWVEARLAEHHATLKSMDRCPVCGVWGPDHKTLDLGEQKA